jgi:MvdD-like protein with pre-ATP grasp domain
MKPEVLIITNSRDESVDLVLDQLSAFRKVVYRLNTDTLGTSQLFTLLRAGSMESVFLDTDSSRCDLSEVSSVWWRRPDVPTLPQPMRSDYRKFAEQEWTTALWSMYTTLDAFWVNAPLIGFRLLEHNKLYQMKIAAAIGLRVPETIVSNHVGELMAFSRRHNGVLAAKTLKGHILEDAAAEPYLIYTNVITTSDIERFSKDIPLAPVMAQEYIPKKLELRITAVGTELFACAIHSQDSERTRHDWRRYDFERVRHEVFILPTATAKKLTSLMRVVGLQFAAMDLVLTPEDEIVFLELNPNGQWSWIEALTGLPISRSLAQLLAHPPV